MFLLAKSTYILQSLGTSPLAPTPGMGETALAPGVYGMGGPAGVTSRNLFCNLASLIFLLLQGNPWLKLTTWGGLDSCSSEAHPAKGSAHPHIV